MARRDVSIRRVVQSIRQSALSRVAEKAFKKIKISETVAFFAT